MSLPLRRILPARKADDRDGNVVAVLTVERKLEKPFTLSEIETLRLTCDLFTSRIVDMYDHDRWFGVKIARSIRRGLAWFLGAKHTWAKLIAIAVAAFLAYALLFDGMFRVDAPFVFEVSEKQVISAPIESRIKTVYANVGDMVFTPQTAAPFDDLDASCPLCPILRVPHPATTLLVLDTSEIEMKLIGQIAARDEKIKTAELAAQEQKEADKQIYYKQAEEAQATIDGYRWQIEQATITSPIDGVILSGDLRTKINAPVKVGDELYEVGQLQQLRAELSVSEDEISELHVGQTGVLKATSYPGRPVHFSVERITPVATVSGQKNVFKVRAALDPADLQIWMHPGIEGQAKVDVRPEKQAWIWTHRMINWVRMKLWM
jgi:multidrug efflux pump subunit AcrA (membrane-fusion protein)